MKTFRLWQDKEAISAGKVWESEIKAAVSQSVFFIPIITPTVVGSQYCRFELEAFLTREAALGRDDLVFPILYIRVPALEDSTRLKEDPVLSLIAKRQYMDWREFRLRNVNSTEVKEAVEQFCTQICDALRRPWISLEDRKVREEAAVRQQRAEAKRKRQEAEAKRREEEVREQATALARERADEERRKREAEVEQQKAKTGERPRAEVEPLREEAEPKRHIGTEGRRPVGRSESHPSWSLSRPVLVAASLIGLVALGAIGVWRVVVPPMLVTPPTSIAPAATPTPPAPTAMAPAATPAPSAPTPIVPAATPMLQAPTPVAPMQPANIPLSPERERSLKPLDAFSECTNCPEMIVVPAGSFAMGSLTNELGHDSNEGPQHRVTFALPFAVGKFALTFDNWDACVDHGGCAGYRPSDQGWGRGRQPVINLSWNDANAYVAWLSKTTGRPYRLLSEAEREYVTRAGTTTPFWWGNSISTNQANYNGNYTYGSEVKGIYRARTLAVDSFEPNSWGLFQVHGNVWEWVEDCFHSDYVDAPTDGSPRTSGDCRTRVLRGASWDRKPAYLRSAARTRLGWFRARQ